MKKRSVTLQGHATSVTLEDEFWEQLVKIATERKQSIASLIDEIDEDRLQTTKGGLSSALRVYILNHLLAKDIH
jgi:predicted DNA-binding ribbon-helix-helix protein